MGNRFNQFSEEMPPQIQYMPAPNLADQYQRFGSEEFQRGQDVLDKQTQAQQQVREMDIDSANKIASGVKQGVQGGFEAYDKAQQRNLQNRQEARQQAVAEEQLATSKQQRDIAEERRQAELQNLQTEGRVKEAQARSTEVAAKAAESEAAALDKPSTDPKYAGMTNREAQIAADVSTKLMQPEIAKGQLDNERQRIALSVQQLEQEKKLFPHKVAEIDAQIANLKSQQKNAEFTYAENIRQRNVRQYSAQLGNESDLSKRSELAGQMKAQGANPYEVAEALATSRTNDFNRKVLEQTTDPLFAKKTEAHYQAISTQSALTDMGNALKEYRETGIFPSAKSDDALRKFQTALKSVGREKEAESLNHFIAIDGGDLRIGREKEMLAILKSIQEGTARTIKASAETMKDPTLMQLSDQVANSNQDLVPLTGVQKLQRAMTAGQAQPVPVAQGAQPPAPQGPPSLMGNSAFKPFPKPSKVGAK